VVSVALDLGRKVWEPEKQLVGEFAGIVLSSVDYETPASILHKPSLNVVDVYGLP
jgi:hypothetical protein